METEELVTGIVYEDPESVRYEDKVHGYREQGIVNQEWTVEPGVWQKLVEPNK